MGCQSLAADRKWEGVVWQSVILVVGGGTIHFTLKMVAARSSKTLVSYCNTTWCQNPEDIDLNVKCCLHLSTE